MTDEIRGRIVADVLAAARELKTTNDSGAWCWLCYSLVMYCECAAGRLRVALAALRLLDGDGGEPRGLLDEVNR